MNAGGASPFVQVYAVVEGDSEEHLLDKVVAPALETAGVLLTPMRVLRGKGHRGGGSSWQPWRNHLRRLIAEHQARPNVRFTTMLDLYRVPDDTPGYTQPGSAAGLARADAIQAAIAQQLATARLIPYVQVHELETLVLASLQHLDKLLDAPDRNALATLVASIAGLAPEAINDGATTAPSKRLLAHVPSYRKTTHGALALEAAGLASLRQACPRFDAWIAQLEGLGSPALPAPTPPAPAPPAPAPGTTTP